MANAAKIAKYFGIRDANVNDWAGSYITKYESGLGNKRHCVSTAYWGAISEKFKTKHCDWKPEWKDLPDNDFQVSELLFGGEVSADMYGSTMLPTEMWQFVTKFFTDSKSPDVPRWAEDFNKDWDGLVCAPATSLT